MAGTHAGAKILGMHAQIGHLIVIPGMGLSG